MLPGGVRFARGFKALIPEVSELAHCRAITPFRLDSSSMTPSHWVVLARLGATHPCPASRRTAAR